MIEAIELMDKRKVFPDDIAQKVRSVCTRKDGTEVEIPKTEPYLKKKVDGLKKGYFLDAPGKIDWNSFYDSRLYLEEDELVTYGY